MKSLTVAVAAAALCSMTACASAQGQAAGQPDVLTHTHAPAATGAGDDDLARTADGRVIVVQEAHYAHSVATEEQLFDRSGEVALAQAATVRYLKTPTGLAYTLQTFVVRESFVGGASPGSHITLQFPGGELDRTRATGPADPKGYFVIDSSWPTFAPDAEYLLFLEETPTVDVHSEGARVAVSQGVGAYQVSGRRLVPPPSLRDHPVAKALQGRDYQEVGRAAAERRRVR